MYDVITDKPYDMWINETLTRMKKSSSHNSSVCLCAQGFPGDFGERGPPGPDGNPVSGTDVSQQYILYIHPQVSVGGHARTTQALW